MKLVCYAENDVLSYGVHLEEKIISLPELANSLNEKLPKIFEDFIIQEGGIKKA